jgi:hypothetical protein
MHARFDSKYVISHCNSAPFSADRIVMSLDRCGDDSDSQSSAPAKSHEAGTICVLGLSWDVRGDGSDDAIAQPFGCTGDAAGEIGVCER